MNWGGNPEASWPPGYPILLSIFTFSIFDPLQVAGIINVVLTGLTIFLTGRWLMQRIESRFLVMWSCLVIAFAHPLRLVAYSVWSEAAFILFVMLSLVWMDKYLMTEKRSSLIMVAVFTACACMTRYMGITILITILILLTLHPQLTFWNKAKQIGLYVVTSCAPMGIWLIRNILSTGTLTGRRYPSDVTFFDNVQLMINVLAQWWQPFHHFKTVFQPVSIPITTGVLLGLAFLVGCTFILWLKNPAKLRNKHFILVAGIFVFVYLAFILWSISTTKVLQPLNYRYLAPAYIPLLILIIFALDRFGIYCRERSHSHPLTALRGAIHAIPIVMFFLLSIFAGYAGYAAALDTKAKMTRGGMGYISKTWLESETLKASQEYSPARIYSNAPYVIYISHNQPQSALNTYRYLPPEKDALTERIHNVYVNQKNVYIIWFNVHSENKRFDYDASYLNDLHGLELIAKLDDGVILRVDRKLL